MVRRADSGGGREAAIHSGLDSALGSHPCVALSSYQAPPLYGRWRNPTREKHPFWQKTALNPGGVGGAAPNAAKRHMSSDCQPRRRETTALDKSRPVV